MLRETVAPAARALAAHFGETVHVAAPERENVVYVASERPAGGVAAPPAPAIGLCAPSERFASRGDVYARARAATSKRVSRAVRL